MHSRRLPNSTHGGMQGASFRASLSTSLNGNQQSVVSSLPSGVQKAKPVTFFTSSATLVMNFWRQIVTLRCLHEVGDTTTGPHPVDTGVPMMTIGQGGQGISFKVEEGTLPPPFITGEGLVQGRDLDPALKAVYPNPDLDPEESRHADIHVRQGQAVESLVPEIEQYFILQKDLQNMILRQERDIASLSLYPGNYQDQSQGQLLQTETCLCGENNPHDHAQGHEKETRTQSPVCQERGVAGLLTGIYPL